MSASSPLLGSAFHPPHAVRAGHRRLRPLSAGELRAEIGVTLLLRENPSGPSLAQTLAWIDATPPCARRHLEIAQLAARHGYAEADRGRVANWAAASGVRIAAVDPATRRVIVQGEASRLADLFGTQLHRYVGPGPRGTEVEYRGYSGSLRTPAALDGVVEGVFGLDDRPVARSQLRGLADRSPALVSYDPPEIAGAYAYPRLPDGGAGLHLVAGMIELGGVVQPRDLATSFTRLGLAPPNIVNLSVDGAVPSSDPDGADVEVALDYQVLGAMVQAMAPRARLTIVVYNAPNCERGFIDAVATAAADATHRPAAISISWGSPENNWTAQGLRGMDAAFAAGGARGVTFSASAGDWGSTNAELDGMQHVLHPASSPHVWACGGTTLLTARGRILSETVWNELARGQGAAGSGVSAAFPPPEYQARSGIQARSANDGRLGRGLPDGSGNADPVTGWNVLSGGLLRITGGTSAVAPMYTALWTLITAYNGRPVGLPHATVYATAGRGFTDVISGNTGGPYRAGRGWDLASGWGSPDGVRLARELDRASVVRAPRITVRNVSKSASRATLEL